MIVVILRGRKFYIVYVGDFGVVFGWLNKEEKFEVVILIIDYKFDVFLEKSRIELFGGKVLLWKCV